MNMNIWVILIVIHFAKCADTSRVAELNYPYYNLPDFLRQAIPKAGQQYINPRDGTYHFEYDTGDLNHQSFRGESRDEHGVVRGYYGYIDPDGILRLTEYIADQMGYRAKTTLRYPVQVQVEDFNVMRISFYCHCQNTLDLKNEDEWNTPKQAPSGYVAIFTDYQREQ